MAQKTTGLHAILSHAWLYNLAQRLVGAERARRKLVQNYFPNKGGYRMLDIGCGTAEILRHLPDDIDYVGFDASEAYIAGAKERFGRRGTFRAELVRGATLAEIGTFDLVLAFGLLHHLDDDEAKTVFRLAHQALKPGGLAITVDPVYVEGQNRLARWVISQDRGRSIRNADGYAALASEQFSDVRASLRHDMLNIPYSHLILECRRDNA